MYREIFESYDDPGTVVLEHHSGAYYDDSEDGGMRPSQQFARLSAENWNAPIIVTTTVQLFESLFSNRVSKARKVHNLANAVIVLDEVQSLPIKLLDPILDGLRELTVNYGSSVVLSTATQPAFDYIPVFKDVSARGHRARPQAAFRCAKACTLRGAH